MEGQALIIACVVFAVVIAAGAWWEGSCAGYRDGFDTCKARYENKNLQDAAIYSLPWRVSGTCEIVVIDKRMAYWAGRSHCPGEPKYCWIVTEDNEQHPCDSIKEGKIACEAYHMAWQKHNTAIMQG